MDFFSIIVTVHLFLIKAVPKFTALIYQIVHKQTGSFSYFLVILVIF